VAVFVIERFARVITWSTAVAESSLPVFGSGVDVDEIVAIVPSLADALDGEILACTVYVSVEPSVRAVLEHVTTCPTAPHVPPLVVLNESNETCDGRLKTDL